ncbi:hypothetical protein AB0C91_28790 [Streptomyces sp. NPDC048674]|uniref:hypothetical protein n=1 Tax=Streptomyces sp. NPDC048674 TaxID=3155491 RepID=UPI003448842D
MELFADVVEQARAQEGERAEAWGQVGVDAVNELAERVVGSLACEEPVELLRAGDLMAATCSGLSEDIVMTPFPRRR